MNFFDVKVKDKGMMIRVYDDNAATISYRGKDEQKRVEEFRVATANLKVMREGREPVVIEEHKPMEPIVREGEHTTVEVTINASGVWVHGESVTAVERTEDGAVYLYYQKGDRTFRVAIKGPSPVGEPEVSDEVGFLAKTPEEVLLLALSTFKTKKGGEWHQALDQDQVDTARKILDEDRLRSFVDEISDYERLEKIGMGETEISGFKVRVEKAEGDGRSFYQLEVVETASVMRVYEDGTIAVKNEGRFWRLDPETLKIDAVKPLDDSESEMGKDNLGPWSSY